jgi:hypothetical protein
MESVRETTVMFHLDVDRKMLNILYASLSFCPVILKPSLHYKAAMTPKKAAASPPIPLTTIPATAALEANVVTALDVPETLLLPVAAVPLLELPKDVTTTTAVLSPETVDFTVVLAGPVVDIPVVVIDPVKPALYCAQRELPILTTLPRSLAAHALRRQGAARFPIVDCVGPHWQAWSFAAQPAAETAEAIQDVAQGSSAVRVCALARERMAERAERAKSWNLMVLIGDSCRRV